MIFYMSEGDCSLIDYPGGVYYVHITFKIVKDVVVVPRLLRVVHTRCCFQGLAYSHAATLGSGSGSGGQTHSHQEQS